MCVIIYRVVFLYRCSFWIMEVERCWACLFAPHYCYRGVTTICSGKYVVLTCLISCFWKVRLRFLIVSYLELWLHWFLVWVCLIILLLGMRVRILSNHCSFSFSLFFHVLKIPAVVFSPFCIRQNLENWLIWGYMWALLVVW